jgi:predicted glutamine amidotransferase
MCKIGFISASEQGDYTKLVMLSSIVYGRWNDDGFGVAYHDGDKIKVRKEPIEALKYWFKNDIQLKTDSLLMHCRKKTCGALDIKSTHPFVSEDAKYVMIHNGVLHSYKEAWELLEKKHKFASEVDSELLLHAYEEWGDDFIKKLAELKVGGYANVAIMINNKDKAPTLKVYSDGGIVLYKKKGLVMGFTDDTIYGSEKAIKTKEGNLYTIENGSILSELDIGKLYVPVYTKQDCFPVYRNGLLVEDDEFDDRFWGQGTGGHLPVMSSVKKSHIRWIGNSEHRFCLYCNNEISPKKDEAFRNMICEKCTRSIEKKAEILNKKVEDAQSGQLADEDKDFFRNLVCPYCKNPLSQESIEFCQCMGCGIWVELCYDPKTDGLIAVAADEEHLTEEAAMEMGLAAAETLEAGKR